MFSYQSNITQGRRKIKKGKNFYINLIKQLNITKTYVPPNFIYKAKLPPMTMKITRFFSKFAKHLKRISTKLYRAS